MTITLNGDTGIQTPMYNGTITANAVTPSVNMKNRIINGNCVIDQRNAGASFSSSANSAYNLDRWYNQNNSAGTRFTVQQNAGSVTPPTGFRNYLGVTSTSAYTVGSTDVLAIGQKIEGFNTADLMWGTASAQTVTLSFWVRSSLTGSFGGSVSNNDGNRFYPYSYTISSANTWEQKTITLAGDVTGTWNTTNSAGIQLLFNLGTGATFSGTAGAWTSSPHYAPVGAVSVVGTNGATFYITGVQLEVGSTATSFDYRPYGTELMLCQRYFVKYLGNNPYESMPYTYALSAASTQAFGPLCPPNVMRTAFSISTSGANTFRLIDGANSYIVSSITNSGGNYSGPWQMEIYVQTTGLTAARTHYISANNTTSAYIYLSAEL